VINYNNLEVIMALKEVPLSVFERHEVLFGENTPKEELLQIGISYFNKGLIYDALEYFEKCDNRDYLEKIKHIAIEEGDLLLYQSSLKALKEEIKREDLLKLKENSIKMGKISVSDEVDFLLVNREKK
jgi:hypothetical protein